MYYTAGQTNPLNDEIEWGLRYREETKKAKTVPLPPKPSPIDVKALWQKYQITKKIEDIEALKKQIVAKPPPKNLHLHNANRISKTDRSAFTKKQYINFLSTPLRRYTRTPKKKNSLLALRRQLAKREKCTARLLELSKPTKLRVYCTWKDHWNGLPAEVVERLNALLHTDHTLEPDFARCCFKELDRKKNKERYKRRKRHRLRDKKKRKEDSKWLKTQIDSTVNLFTEFLQRESVYALNYKQMLVSNAIVQKLMLYKCFKEKPIRTSSKPYQKSIIELIDQLALWMDTVSRYIDVKMSESEERLQRIEEVLEMEEEEEGEGGEGSLMYKGFGGYEGGDSDYFDAYQTQKFGGDSETDDGTKTDKYDDTSQLQGQKDGDKTEDVTDEESQKQADGDLTGEAGKIGVDGEMVVEGVVTGLGDGAQTQAGPPDTDEDVLGKLISILSESPSGFLKERVDQANMPNVTYDHVLHRVKSLRDEEVQQKKLKRQDILQKSITEWAKKNEPDQVDDKLIRKIHSAAEIISECIEKDADKGDKAPGTSADAKPAGVSAAGAAAPPSAAAGGAAPPSAAPPSAAPPSAAPGAVGSPSAAAGVAVPPSGAAGKEPPSVASETTPTSTVSQATGTPGGDIAISLTSDTDKGISEMTDSAVQPEDWSDMERERTSVKFKSPTEEEGEGQYEPGAITKPAKSAVKKKKPPGESVSEIGGLEIESGAGEDLFGIIRKHDPPETFEHAPDSICCLTIKVWAMWLLEVANNAEKWSEWLCNIIKEIKWIASILRGEVLDDNGNMVKFYQDDWKAFVEKVENMIIAWRQYSMHVKDLTEKIINNFHGKRITCCPKCLEDNLIVNIAVAHDISQQLAEAMNTASYWRRWLDKIMMDTQRLTSIKLPAKDGADAISQGSSFDILDLVEIELPRRVQSEESYFEILELEYCKTNK